MVGTVVLPIEEVARKTKRKLVTAFQELTQDITEEVIHATPWDTGFLRASWFVSINSPGGIPKGVGLDPAGVQTIARASAEIAGAEIGDVIYVLNGAVYAKFLEFGTAYISPRAFVRGTIARAPQIAQRTIERIARK